MSTYRLSKVKEPETTRFKANSGIPQPIGFRHVGDPENICKFPKDKYLKSKSRICRLDCSNKDKEYGFDLTTLKSQRGHFIESVRSGSLSDDAGFKEGDMILEINGKTIQDMSHRDIVHFIKKEVADKSVAEFVLKQQDY